MKLSKIENNLEKENEGVWLTYDGDIEVKIARFGNDRYQKIAEALYKPVKKQLQRGSLGSKRATELASKAVAKGIIVDWRGIEDDDGNLIPFSEEKAIEFMLNPKLKDFKDWIANESQSIANFENEVLEEEVELVKKS